MKKILIILALTSIIISCKNDKKEYNYILKPDSTQIIIPIDDNTNCYCESMFKYTDTTGVNYLSLENKQTNELVIYNLDSCSLSHKIKIEQEGPNGIGRIWGHHIIDSNNILLYGLNTFTIYLINKHGKILNNYKLFDNKDPLFCNPPISMIYAPMVVIDSCIYLNQYLMSKNDGYDGDDLESYPIEVEVNMKNKTAKKLPLTYPRLWEEKLSYPIFDYSREFDGKNFIFSFNVSNYIYVTKDNISFKKYFCKSKYIKDKPINHYNPDPYIAKKQNIENASYGSILYDKYRNIYYRFVYPQSELSKQENLSEAFKTRKQFSIIILNSEFQIIGESLFPENIYIPRMFFIKEDGLYISNNNFNNPEFNENELRFQLFKFVKQ